MIFPDNPVRVGPEFLKLCDREAPGKYIAQKKGEGHRRISHCDNGAVLWQSKRQSEAERMENQEEYENEIRHLDGVSLDHEYIGPVRCLGEWPRKELYTFDILRYAGQWLRNVAFSERIIMMRDLGIKTPRQATNPGLLDFFMEQMQDPTSEGIVVRRADSGLILDESRCRDNPFMWKVKNR